jgi:hypothetical protein
MGTVFTNKDYKATLTLLKFLVTTLPAIGAGFLSTVIEALPSDAVWPAVWAGLFAGLYRATRNVFNQKKPEVKLP